MFICWSPPPYGNREGVREGWREGTWSPTKKKKRAKRSTENRKGGREEVCSSSHRGERE